MGKVLVANNITKKYGNHTVLQNISFELESGKCIALIGPNGAGKTTTLRILTGLIKQTSGKFNYFHSHVNGDFRSSIGYLPQHPIMHNWMTGKEYLIYCANLTFIKKEEATKRAEQLLQKVGIMESKDKRIGTYSGGMKQRLGIAQAIIHKPKLLIMDEPVSALDPIGRREVLTLMEELKKEMTVLFSTHILSDADEISDGLLLLHQGEIVESGSMETLRKKYQTTKIEIGFDDYSEKYVNQIQELSTVKAVDVKRDTIHVTVTNIELARKEILSSAINKNWPLAHFVVNRASLEDMFMKVVQS